MTISTAIAEKRISRHYILRDNDRFMLRDMLNPSNHEVKATLLSGPPGTGKTYFAECFAFAIGGRYDGTNGRKPDDLVLLQVHRWTTNEDLHRAPNIAAFAARNSLSLDDEPAWIKGALWLASELSQVKPTVLCLDEIDKTLEPTEHSLLEYLESGEFRLPNGTVVSANLNNLFIFLTTNETRELHEATLRRVYRHRMEFLPPAKEAELVRHQTNAPLAACRACVDAANLIRGKGLSSPSTKEIKYLLLSMSVARSSIEAEYAFRGRLIKQHDLPDQDIRRLAQEIYGAYSRK